MCSSISSACVFMFCRIFIYLSGLRPLDVISKGFGEGLCGGAEPRVGEFTRPPPFSRLLAAPGWVCICAPGAGPRSLPAGRGLSAPDIGCAPPIAARLGLVLGSRTEIAGTCVQLHGPAGDVETHKLQARLGSMIVLCLDRRTCSRNNQGYVDYT